MQDDDSRSDGTRSRHIMVLLTALLISIGSLTACGPPEESRSREKASAAAKEQDELSKRQTEENSKEETKELERDRREERALAEERTKGGRNALLRQAVQIVADSPHQPARRTKARIDALWADLEKVPATDRDFQELKSKLAKIYNSLVPPSP